MMCIRAWESSHDSLLSELRFCQIYDQLIFSLRCTTKPEHFFTLKADQPRLQNYPHKPPNYRHTGIAWSKLEVNCTLRVLTNTHTHSQTIPSALSPCFAKAPRLIIRYTKRDELQKGRHVKSVSLLFKASWFSIKVKTRQWQSSMALWIDVLQEFMQLSLSQSGLAYRWNFTDNRYADIDLS